MKPVPAEGRELSSVVGWTVFGASVAPIVLIVFGVLLAADNPDPATSANPVGVLAEPLPTWFLVPYMLVAVGGLVAGALLDRRTSTSGLEKGMLLSDSFYSWGALLATIALLDGRGGDPWIDLLDVPLPSTRVTPSRRACRRLPAAARGERRPRR
jgi:hypothetical protein